HDTPIYTLSLHDALPISLAFAQHERINQQAVFVDQIVLHQRLDQPAAAVDDDASAILPLEVIDFLDDVVADQHRVIPVRRGECRSEEHTSELQSRENLVC